MDNFIEMMKEPEVIWFLLGLLLLVIELFSLSLIVGFFGVGAWATSVILFFADISFSNQLVVFVISSLLALITLRKFIKNKFFDGHLTGDTDNTELKDEFIGHKVLVEKTIEINKPGKVSFNGTPWTAISDTEIKKGEMAEIIAIDSTVLTVKSI